eukprot:gnl/MRDRNA2_/MRDRNA2_115191_c0_seq1.p1 gnl/MRDRNA2_/MRDRNA2_115191_c0~~gnl/MRDRNA2_/MRDRNA2_115191_c0_seq1.p1  ORF type:complete len:418 (-),score=96.67 gnl/MRDRNA2_/MRDRNA2_115191_c0_seq1:730-1983(-)
MQRSSSLSSVVEAKVIRPCVQRSSSLPARFAAHEARMAMREMRLMELKRLGKRISEEELDDASLIQIIDTLSQIPIDADVLVRSKIHHSMKALKQHTCYQVRKMVYKYSIMCKKAKVIIKKENLGKHETISKIREGFQNSLLKVGFADYTLIDVQDLDPQGLQDNLAAEEIEAMKKLVENMQKVVEVIDNTVKSVQENEEVKNFSYRVQDNLQKAAYRLSDTTQHIGQEAQVALKAIQDDTKEMISNTNEGLNKRLLRISEDVGEALQDFSKNIGEKELIKNFGRDVQDKLQKVEEFTDNAIKSVKENAEIKKVGDWATAEMHMLELLRLAKQLSQEEPDAASLMQVIDKVSHIPVDGDVLVRSPIYHPLKEALKSLRGHSNIHVRKIGRKLREMFKIAEDAVDNQALCMDKASNAQ